MITVGVTRRTASRMLGSLLRSHSSRPVKTTSLCDSYRRASSVPTCPFFPVIRIRMGILTSVEELCRSYRTILSEYKVCPEFLKENLYLGAGGRTKQQYSGTPCQDRRASLVTYARQLIGLKSEDSERSDRIY